MVGRDRLRRVLFRVDASDSIGTGHVVRSLALASELERRGMEPWFASRRATGDRVGQIEGLGYPVIPLIGSVADDLASISARAPCGTRRRPFCTVVVDHYGLGEEWLNSARKLATDRLAIDDLADRSLPCEVLVNPNLGVEPVAYTGLVTPATRLLLGCRYAILRPPFRAARAALRRPTGPVENVLITMGGSDQFDVTSAAIAAVQSALPAARIDVVVGDTHTGGPAPRPGLRVHRAVGGAKMAQLMMAADIVVGAGGTTSWERCALGRPSVIIRVASNQDQIARRLDAAGVAVDAGPADQLETAVLANLIRRLADDVAGRKAMSDRAWEIVDGRGVERIAHHVDVVRVRRATMADARLLWNWANDPDTRAASLKPEPIPYPRHVSWLRDRLSDRSCLLLIGENGAGQLGQVRFDYRESDAEVSISVAPEHRGTVGGLLLDSTVRRFRSTSPRTPLSARVKVDNGPSRRLFERAGFSLVSEDRGVLLYRTPSMADATPSVEAVAGR